MRLIASLALVHGIMCLAYVVADDGINLIAAAIGGGLVGIYSLIITEI